MLLILTSGVLLAGTAVALQRVGLQRRAGATIAQILPFLHAAALRQALLFGAVYGCGMLLAGPLLWMVAAVLVILWAGFEALNLASYRFFGVALLAVLPHLPVKAADKGALGAGLALLHGNLPWRGFAGLAALATACLMATQPSDLTGMAAVSLGLAGLARAGLAFRKAPLTISAVEQHFLTLDPDLPHGRLHRSTRRQPVLRAAPPAPPETILLILSESAGRQVPAPGPDSGTLATRICGLGGRSADWIVPANALTASSCTDVSIPCLMTGCAPYRDLATLQAMPTLFDLAKARGMQTLFYSSGLLAWAHFDQFFDSTAIDTVCTPQEAGFPVIHEMCCDDYLMAERFCQTLRASTGPLFAVIYLNSLHIPFQSDSTCGVPAALTDRLHRASHISETCHSLILNTLVETGRYDSALILCAGDHGEDASIAGPQTESHLARLTQLTTAVVHPMFLLKPPAHLPKTEAAALRGNADRLVSLLDIAPTVAAALALDPPADMAFDGLNLLQPVPADRVHITLNTNGWRPWPRSAVMIAQGLSRVCADYQNSTQLCTDTDGQPFAAQDARKDRLLAKALAYPAASKVIAAVFADKTGRRA